MSPTPAPGLRRRLAGTRTASAELQALVDGDPPPVGSALRVLAVSGSAELYGSDRMFLEAVAGLVERGHQVDVALGADGPLVTMLERTGARVRIVPAPVLRRAYLSPRGLVRLADVVRRAWPGMRSFIRHVDPDVIYVNTLTLPAWHAAALSTRTPLVVHVHEAEAARPRLVRSALAAPLWGADTVLFNSRHSRDLAASDLGITLPPSCVVLNGVEMPPGPTPPRESLDGPVRLVYVGRLSPRKGVDVAVAAAALLQERGIDVRLDIVGEVFHGYEWYRTQLQEQIADGGLGEAVVLRGFHPSARDFVDAADIALVPTRRDEPFGNVLVEAVGAMRPTVAAAQAGLMEAGRGLPSVRYARPDDPGSLADEIEAQIVGWKEQRMAVQADAEEVRRRHDPARYRARIASVVERTIAR